MALDKVLKSLPAKNRSKKNVVMDSQLVRWTSWEAQYDSIICWYFLWKDAPSYQWLGLKDNEEVKCPELENEEVVALEEIPVKDKGGLQEAGTSLLPAPVEVTLPTS